MTKSSEMTRVELPMIVPDWTDPSRLVHGRVKMDVRTVSLKDAPDALIVDRKDGGGTTWYRLFEGKLWRDSRLPAEETFGSSLLGASGWLDLWKMGCHPLLTSKKSAVFLKDTRDRYDRWRAPDSHSLEFCDTFEATRRRAERVIVVDGKYHVRTLPPFWRISRELRKAQLSDAFFGWFHITERLDAFSYSKKDEFEARLATIAGGDIVVQPSELTFETDFPQAALEHDADAGALEAAAWMALSRISATPITAMSRDAVYAFQRFRMCMQLRSPTLSVQDEGTAHELWPYEIDEFEFEDQGLIAKFMRPMAEEPKAFGLTKREASAISWGLARTGLDKIPDPVPQEDVAALSAV